MTTSQILDILGGQKDVGDKTVNFDPDSIYTACTEAQKEICRETQALEALSVISGVKYQDKYQYSPATILTAVAGATFTTLTATDHAFQTGDTIRIGGEAVMTNINGKWVVTVVDANTFTIPIVGVGTYGGSGVAYHTINSASKLKFARTLTPHIHPLTITNTSNVEYDREDISHTFGHTGGDVVLQFPYGQRQEHHIEMTSVYLTYDEPVIIGFFGKPHMDFTAEIKHVRMPLPIEDIGITVDPILPDSLKTLLIMGTRYYAFQFRMESNVREMLPQVKKEYYGQLALEVQRKSKERLAMGTQSPNGVVWR